MNDFKTTEEVEYDTKNAKRVLYCLEKSERGLTISDIAQDLGLNRHTVTKLLERMLMEKKANYDEKGPAKIFYSTGKSRFVGRLDQGKFDKIWIDVMKPKYLGEEVSLRLNQTKHDHLIRATSKFRSVGAISIKKSQLVNLIRILRDVARKEFKENV
jgi:predicted ArsR family transcriptional regulator